MAAPEPVPAAAQVLVPEAVPARATEWVQAMPALPPEPEQAGRPRGVSAASSSGRPSGSESAGL